MNAMNIIFIMEPSNIPLLQVPCTPPGVGIQTSSTAPGFFAEVAHRNILPGSVVHTYNGTDPVPTTMSTPDLRGACLKTSLFKDIAVVDAVNAAYFASVTTGSSSGSPDSRGAHVCR